MLKGRCGNILRYCLLADGKGGAASIGWAEAREVVIRPVWPSVSQAELDTLNDDSAKARTSV